MQIARFNKLRLIEAVDFSQSPDVLFCRVGVDSRAAGCAPESQQGLAFLIFALHASLNGARQFLASSPQLSPWLQQAAETWSALLQPFRISGESNYFDRLNGGPIFEKMADAPAPNEPLVVMTSAGWRQESLNPARVRDFAIGVESVRSTMQNTEGLHSQHSFIFPGMLVDDPVTVSTWKTTEAMKTWAYTPGIHRHYLEKHRQQPMADRASFSRFRILQSSGSWNDESL